MSGGLKVVFIDIGDTLGLVAGAPLKLTLSEAMAVFLGARLMVRYADKYDPDLAAAFEKLAEILPGDLDKVWPVLILSSTAAASAPHEHDPLVNTTTGPRDDSEAIE